VPLSPELSVVQARDLRLDAWRAKPAKPNGSGGRTRTGDTAIMSRLLFRLSYTASPGVPLPRLTEPQYGIEP
jgi:hypothetical protein